MKSRKPMSASEAMMMFGGSATMVDTPPMFDANTCASRKGTGLIPSVRQIESVIGTASTTTVTLSRSAEETAVSRHIRQSVRKAVAADKLGSLDGRPVERSCPGDHVREGHHPGQQQDDLQVHVRQRLVPGDGPKEHHGHRPKNGDKNMGNPPNCNEQIGKTKYDCGDYQESQSGLRLNQSQCRVPDGIRS